MRPSPVPRAHVAIRLPFDPPFAAPDVDLPLRMLDAIPAPAGLLDVDRRWRAANAALAARFDAAATRPGQRAFADLSDDDARAFDACLQAARDGAAAPSVRVALHGRDAMPAPMEIACGALRDRDGRHDGWLLTLRDLDDDAARAGLRAERDEAQRALQLFTDAVSHDLRAPLRAIDSFSARLEGALDAGDAAARDHLARIRAAAARMGGLLSSLSQYNRAARTELASASVDLGALFEWACMDLQAKHPDRGAQLDIPHGLLVRGDERLLQMMARQLADNAWRFARDGEPVRLRIDVRRDGAMLSLALHDAGRGFDMRYAHKLFQPFQRLHGPEHGSGHGLGLAIARRVVERHGGGIRAESTPETGTTFHIDLPAAPGAEARPA